MPSSISPAGDPGKPFVEFVRDERDYDREQFNRISYAKRLLRILSPSRMTVALCPGTEKLSVSHGADLGHPSGKRWAIVSIPPDASRAHIAVALAKLAGRDADPYVLDVLLQARGG
jgi:hypothetical protein